MKKLILLIAIIASAFSALAQDSLYINKKDGTIIPYAIAKVDSITLTRKSEPSNNVDFVLIYGTKWATKNVDYPGTFTASPESPGMLYQWNSKVGWPATGAIGSITTTDGSSTWNASWNGGFELVSLSDSWATANDPSPIGYRLPTYNEMMVLLNTTYVSRTWTTQKGVYGCIFTDKSSGNSIFLPASGARDNLDGDLYASSSSGLYWTQDGSGGDASCLIFDNSNYAVCYGRSRASAVAIRPVIK